MDSCHRDAGGSSWREGLSEHFDRFACAASQHAGRASTFILAVALVVVWALAGPFFGFSEAWQLVINTGTTIITFLMVFVIQHAQNRDTAAIQLKLSELIVAIRAADNRVAVAEDMNDDEIERAKRSLKDRVQGIVSELSAPAAGHGAQSLRDA